MVRSVYFRLVIGIGIIGLGHWGPNYVRHLWAHPTVEIVWACDIEERRRAVVQRLFPDVKTVADSRVVLGDPAVTAVVISTPTGTHYALVKEAIAAGKDVLCEKPLATNAVEARELADLAHRSGRILMVGHTFLFNPGILKLKELLDANALGRVYYMHAERTNLGPIRSDVNAVLDLASHDVSILNLLRGTLPDTVAARGGQFLRTGIEDVAFVTLQYPDNVLASIMVSWLHPQKVREITVVGDRKMIIWNDLGSLGPLMLFDKTVQRDRPYVDFGEFNLLAREGDISVPRVDLVEPLKLQTEHFILCLEKRSTPVTPAEQGVDVARVLDAVNRSIGQGGTPCPVEKG